LRGWNVNVIYDRWTSLIIKKEIYRKRAATMGSATYYTKTSVTRKVKKQVPKPRLDYSVL
jgi:hypothetical protein